MNTVAVKTSELIGPALDWAVAKCMGLNVEGIAERKADHIATWLAMPIPPVRNVIEYCDAFYRGKYIGPCGLNLIAIHPYSTDWSQGGPIIERESIDTFTEKKSYHDSWLASVARYQNAKKLVGWRIHQYGPTPLIAAMRCYVASKLGDTVQIPRELVP